MSDQYTRISCGGSPLEKTAPVVGLLFGERDEDTGFLQIRDADEIGTEISDATTIQVDLHKAVFPQHSVVGWYRVSQDDEIPTPSDEQITQRLQKHHAAESSFYFCLLTVENPNRKPASTEEATTELPIHLYEWSAEASAMISPDWKLETADPERIAVERVLKEEPAQASSVYVNETQALQDSLQSLQDRIQILMDFIESMQQGKLPPNFSLLRQVQSLLYSLGPLSALAAAPAPTTSTAALPQDAELVSHLAAVAKTVSAVQSYTDKFRAVHESKLMTDKMRRMF